MNNFRWYILSFISVALICSVIKNLIGPIRRMEGLINVICGLFMAITALSPIVNLEIPDVRFDIQTIYTAADQISYEATSSARENMAGIIKEEAQAYILEKASSLNMDIDVEVKLNDADLVPESIVVSGSVSPYEKTLLGNYINKTLDIPEERQLWKE